MASISPLTGMSKSERVYQALRTGILEGKFSPGYRFVLDRIARDMGVSPVPVREAVRRLEAEGLVSFQRNVGAIVSAVDKDDYAKTMESVALLEGYATALSAPLLSEDDLAAATETNDQMRRLMESSFDPREATRLNSLFHRQLTHVCPNTHLFELLEREWDRVTIIRRTQFAFDSRHSMRSVNEHAEILTAIRSGAAASEVERLVREHKLRTMRQYVSE